MNPDVLVVSSGLSTSVLTFYISTTLLQRVMNELFGFTFLQMHWNWKAGLLLGI